VTEKNVELHRRGLEAVKAWDTDAFIGLCDPQIELRSSMTTPGGAVYHGHDGVRRYVAELEDVWGQLEVVPEALFDLGDHTLAFIVARGRGRQSGAEVAREGAHVAKWRNGRCVYFRIHLNRDDALEELGVSEDALEPIALEDRAEQ
jgi:ketosteroid isomerase-like protein